MYGKLFASLYHGTLRGHAHEILVFSNMIAHADKDGYVDKHWRAIAEECGLSVDEVKAACQKLEAPDPESRSAEADGARIIRVDDHRAWGWRITNYAKYRAIRSEEDRRIQNRDAKRREREKSALSATVSRSQPSSAHAEAEAEAEALQSKKYGVRFAQPSQQEVDFECAKIGLPPAEGVKFVAFYASKGWKVGKSPMKNWRMALVGWRTRWEESRRKAAKSPLAGMSAAEMDLETVKWQARLDAEKEAF